MFGKEDQEFSFGYDKQMPVRYTGGDVGNMDQQIWRVGGKGWRLAVIPMTTYKCI